MHEHLVYPSNGSIIWRSVYPPILGKAIVWCFFKSSFVSSEFYNIMWEKNVSQSMISLCDYCWLHVSAFAKAVIRQLKICM